MMKLVVLSCLVAAASAGGLASFAPLAYSAPFGYAAPIAYSASLLAPSNYRGPLSLAPGQPANILAADGRPLDTLEVNLDRSAHYTAKALDGAGIHLLKKRSAPLIAPYGGIAVARSPLIAPYGGIAVARSPLIAPVAYSTPIATSHISNLAYSAPLTYTTQW